MQMSLFPAVSAKVQKKWHLYALDIFMCKCSSCKEVNIHWREKDQIKETKMPTELWSRNDCKREQLEYQETDMRQNYSI